MECSHDNKQKTQRRERLWLVAEIASEYLHRWQVANFQVNVEDLHEGFGTQEKIEICGMWVVNEKPY